MVAGVAGGGLAGGDRSDAAAAVPAPVVAAAASSPSGQAMPVGDLAGWRQVFADDFTVDIPLGSFPEAVSSRWGAYPEGWPDTSHNGVYSPHRVLSVRGGVLDWWIHTEAGVHLVAVPYPLIPGASARNGLTAGRYVVRFRADPLRGYKTAWLLWPDSEVWPRDGEIDFPEGNLDGTISGFVHAQGATSPGDQAAFATKSTYRSWHTAVMEWTPARVTFLLDGRKVGTTTNRIPNTSMHWVLQTETGLDGYAPADWVAVYRPK